MTLEQKTLIVVSISIICSIISAVCVAYTVDHDILVKSGGDVIVQAPVSSITFIDGREDPFIISWDGGIIRVDYGDFRPTDAARDFFEKYLREYIEENYIIIPKGKVTDDR